MIISAYAIGQSPTLLQRGRELHKGVNTGKQGPLGAILEARCHEGYDKGIGFYSRGFN